MTVDVIVAGGGPVGMMTAALLDAAGVRVEVYERKTRPGQESRGTTMHPRTLEVLTMLELDGRRVSDILVEQGNRLPHAHFAMLPDRLDYRDLDTPFPFVLMLPQWRTEQVLAEYLRARGVPVHGGAEVSEVEQSADEVRVRVDGSWRAARYLVGADGAHSGVRKCAGIGFVGNSPNVVGFAGDVRLTEPVHATRYFWQAEAGHAAVVPLGENIFRIFGTEATDAGLSADRARLRQAEPFTLAELRAALNRICGADFGVHSPVWLSRSSNSSRHAERYRDGRIMLVGDAAHVHLPAGGQGLNVGLQDAANLAWKLAAEVHGWAPDRLREGHCGYDSERRPIAARLLADTLSQDALMHTFTPAGAALREMFTGFIARGGEVATQLAGWMSGLAVGYSRTDDDHPLVGTRAPDSQVTGGTLLRALRPDRFLLLDFAGDRPDVGSDRVEVLAAHRPIGWEAVRAALIRPDGYVAHATDTDTGLVESIGAWTEPDERFVTVRGL
ncbi:FAD-dependent monooxygenase [Nocardia alni]|uniref:FAD-dependent monooxygenase n=1 Tax=Nocardia alni TaxID=2815723 RepID=UPI001C236835|nr:FAD-dependent monooxygenase [Nocardia alni]